MTDLSSLEDSQLAEKAKHDVDAFTVLIHRYERKLLAYIRSISNFSEEDAEEVLQDTFIKAWKYLNSFDSSLKFSSWIYRIAHNETRSLFRKLSSRGRHHQVELSDALANTIATEGGIEMGLENEEHAKYIQEALSHLPKKYREVLILKYVEDRSYEDISDIIKKPQGTVATLLNRAKKQLKVSFMRITTSS